MQRRSRGSRPGGRRPRRERGPRAEREAQEADRRTLDQTLPTVPPLTDGASCGAVYDAIARRCGAGLLNGTQGSAAVRAVDGYRVLLSDEMDRARLATLEDRIAELERELAEARRVRLA
jgi:hypothetical protein